MLAVAFLLAHRQGGLIAASSGHSFSSSGNWSCGQCAPCSRPGVSVAGNSGVLLAGRSKLVPRGRFAQNSEDLIKYVDFRRCGRRGHY